jgi:hypothetical protein
MDRVELARAMERVELAAAVRYAEGAQDDAAALEALLARARRAEAREAEAWRAAKAARAAYQAGEAVVRDALARVAALADAAEARDAAIAAAGLERIRAKSAEDAAAVVEARLERAELELEHARREIQHLGAALRTTQAERDAAAAHGDAATRRALAEVQQLRDQLASLKRATLQRIAPPANECTAEELRHRLRLDRYCRQWAGLSLERLAQPDLAELRAAAYRAHVTPAGAARAEATETMRRAAARAFGGSHGA